MCYLTSAHIFNGTSFPFLTALQILNPTDSYTGCFINWNGVSSASCLANFLFSGVSLNVTFPESTLPDQPICGWIPVALCCSLSQHLFISFINCVKICTYSYIYLSFVSSYLLDCYLHEVGVLLECTDKSLV